MGLWPGNLIIYGNTTKKPFTALGVAPGYVELGRWLKDHLLAGHRKTSVWIDHLSDLLLHYGPFMVETNRR
jgi:hypothetical protein